MAIFLKNDKILINFLKYIFKNSWGSQVIFRMESMKNYEISDKT